MVLEEIIKYLPRKINREKHRRLYINREYIDSDKLRKIENSIIKAFRRAIIETLKSKGYAIQKEFLRNAENLGPDPDVLWLKFGSDNSIDVIIADTTFHTLDDNSVATFSKKFSDTIRTMGFELLSQSFTSLDNFDEYLVKRVFYAKMKYYM
ncbi:MAG: hypothetical protein QXT53_00635 [Ignisphaera sp.]